MLYVALPKMQILEIPIIRNLQPVFVAADEGSFIDCQGALTRDGIVANLEGKCILFLSERKREKGKDIDDGGEPGGHRAVELNMSLDGTTRHRFQASPRYILCVITEHPSHTLRSSKFLLPAGVALICAILEPVCSAEFLVGQTRESRSLMKKTITNDEIPAQITNSTSPYTLEMNIT